MGNSIYDFLTTEASSSTTGGWNTAEGQAASTVNDGMRAAKQDIAAFVDDLGAVNTVAGTANAITVTIASQVAAYATGLVFAFKNSVGQNTAAATINVTGSAALGVKKIRLQGDLALSGGEMVDDGVYILRYDAAYDAAAGAFVLLNPSLVDGYATTATAAGTTTLTVTSAKNQYFTGTTTQTVTLPVTSTLVLGQSYKIVNNSTGLVTINSSGANEVIVLGSGWAVITCILLTGTTAASWDVTAVNTTGSYTPTGTVGTNVSALTTLSAYYQRVQDVVTVWGNATVDCVATATLSGFDLSLPIASNFGTSVQLGGTAAPSSGGVTETWAIIANSTDDRASFYGVSGTAAAHNVRFLFSYLIA